MGRSPFSPQNGETPLYAAAARGRDQAARALVEAGADITAKCRVSDTLSTHTHNLTLTHSPSLTLSHDHTLSLLMMSEDLRERTECIIYKIFRGQVTAVGGLERAWRSSWYTGEIAFF